MLLPTIISCNKTCSHTFSQGVCEKCGEKCTHTFDNGICTICEQKCEHTFNNDGICSTCEYKCSHSYDKGVCVTCNAVSLTYDDLKGRIFNYEYYELQWSEGATEKQKENLRKKYNKDTDEELFDELHDEYISAETFLFGEWIASWSPIERYKFNSVDGTTVSVYEDDAEYSTGRVVKYTINGDCLEIGYNKLYYAKDRIYLVAKSKLDSEISLKLFFVEK
jgi:hypothetical protein